VLHHQQSENTMVGKRIFIIDDDESVQTMLKLILEKAGYEIGISADGQSIYQQMEPLPDLFLLDKQLNGYDGLEICRYLKSKEATRSIPVMMLSATPGVKPLALEAGADDFLEKPFNSGILMAKIALLLK
jgi:DNA-binding response OmpR family regulator